MCAHSPRARESHVYFQIHSLYHEINNRGIRDTVTIRERVACSHFYTGETEGEKGTLTCFDFLSDVFTFSILSVLPFGGFFIYHFRDGVVFVISFHCCSPLPPLSLSLFDSIFISAFALEFESSHASVLINYLNRAALNRGHKAALRRNFCVHSRFAL